MNNRDENNLIFKLNLQISNLMKQIEKLKATNKVLSNELTKNNIVKQDYIETCCGIPIYEIPKLKEQLIVSEKALELACNELDDAKDMLRECGKTDWAGTLNTSIDYFKARAKEMMKSE